MWFDILYGTWDYLLSTVGVGHLGPTRSGGSAFSLLPLRSVWDTVARAFFVGTHLHSFHGSLWWMVIFVMDVISSMMDFISFMMMDVSCMVDGFIYFIALISWIRCGWCIFIFTYVYSFKPFIPCDMYSGWLSIPNFICQEAFKTNLYYGHWTFHYSFMWFW